MDEGGWMRVEEGRGVWTLSKGYGYSMWMLLYSTVSYGEIEIAGSLVSLLQ